MAEFDRAANPPQGGDEFVTTYDPGRYPPPDWDKPSEIRRVWTPPADSTVGWLAIQDEDKIQFVSFVGPSHPGYGARRAVQEQLRTSFEEGDPVREALNKATKVCLTDAPVIRSLVEAVNEDV